MKIGVIADTHSKPLPDQLAKDFSGVDLIIHAGDFCAETDLAALEGIAPVKGVQGNMDNERIRKCFPVKQVIEVEKARIGLFHGEGPPKLVLKRVMAEFAGETVDAVIFGHSHMAMNELIDGTLYFNPGSPNDTLFAPYCSYGIVDVKGRSVKGKIIKVRS